MGESNGAGAKEMARAKVCVSCGVDCADRPRTKDTKGRYFCKPCFEDLLDRKRRGERISIPGAVTGGAHTNGAPPPPPVAHDPFAALALTDDSPLADPNMLNGVAAGAPPQTVPCPACRAPLTPGAVICVNCGTDPRSGATQKTKIARAPRSGSGGSDATWRVPMGVIAIVAGALGALNYGVAVIASFLLLLAAPLAGLIGLTISLLLFAVPLFHLFGGIGLLRRDQRAVDRLRITSAIFVALCVIGFAGLAIANSAANSASGGPASPDALAYDAGVVFGILLVFCIWPIFAFIFFSRNAVQRAAASW